MWVPREKKQTGKHFSLFLLSLLWHRLPVACPACGDVSFRTQKGEEKKKEEGKLNTVFLLSLKCHERSAERACRG